jgi:hypothetical protein
MNGLQDSPLTFFASFRFFLCFAAEAFSILCLRRTVVRFDLETISRQWIEGPCFISELTWFYHVDHQYLSLLGTGLNLFT